MQDNLVILESFKAILESLELLELLELLEFFCEQSSVFFETCYTAQYSDLAYLGYKK